jgi:hypothetical protein
VAAGKAMARPAKISTSTPRPMVAAFDLWGRNIPVIIFSIPTKNNIIERITIAERKVAPGNARATIDNIIVRIPRIICAALTQPGDRPTDKVLLIG